MSIIQMTSKCIIADLNKGKKFNDDKWKSKTSLKVINYVLNQLEEVILHNTEGLKLTKLGKRLTPLHLK